MTTKDSSACSLNEDQKSEKEIIENERNDKIRLK